MFRKIVMTIALCVSSLSFASTTVVDTSGLTDAQIAELKAIAAATVAKSAKASTETPDVGATLGIAATWGSQAAQAAEGFARAIGIAAKELNVSVNEFLQTDAGKLAAIVIIWKVAGVGILKILYGTFFIIAGCIAIRLVYTRLFTAGYQQVEYSILWGAFKGTKMVRVPKSFSNLQNDGEWLAFWVLLGITAITLGVGSTFFVGI